MNTTINIKVHRGSTVPLLYKDIPYTPSLTPPPPYNKRSPPLQAPQFFFQAEVDKIIWKVCLQISLQNVTPPGAFIWGYTVFSSSSVLGHLWRTLVNLCQSVQTDMCANDSKWGPIFLSGDFISLYIYIWMLRQCIKVWFNLFFVSRCQTEL